tara:strand:+ start:7419 stop:7622 length:204 start_codon:yes stop_codon:yes gene_type:complete
MPKKFYLVQVLGLAIFCSPLHTKEISKKTESVISSSVEEIAEEMNGLNSSLDLLSITISNLVPEKKI